MIDRKTAIQWAKDAGFVNSLVALGYELATPDQIYDLITRAQDEALEAAEKRAERTAEIEIEVAILKEENTALHRRILEIIQAHANLTVSHKVIVDPTALVAHKEHHDN